MRSHTLLSIATCCLIPIAGVQLVGAPPRAQTGTTCKQPPVEPCKTRHGRFSTQNGIAQTIWLIGTNRRVSVDNDPTDFLPANALKFTELTSPDHSYIFGDFTICPIEPDSPGHMRSVCVTAAKNLVVKNADGSTPAFRLRSTWSAPAGRLPALLDRIGGPQMSQGNSQSDVQSAKPATAATPAPVRSPHLAATGNKGRAARLRTDGGCITCARCRHR
jgi:hypothetical protein